MAQDLIAADRSIPALASSETRQGTSRPAAAVQQIYHPKYRPDVDGLRAVAVLYVIAFHAFPSLMPGGFIGVDIFFVISGFLISTIIFNDLKRSRFSFLHFYARRVRRIFPALLVVLAFTLAFGWFALLPDEYKQLGTHVAAGAGFVSNLVLWSESGYFDNAAETKPLLHLWSLGIEEQFYIVWPVALWAAWRKGGRLSTIVALGIVASFALNLLLQANRVADFYSPLTRFWELWVGAALAYLMLQAHAFPRAPQRPTLSPLYSPDARSIAGFLILLSAPFLIDHERPYPGFWALLPVAGAALVLSAREGAWLNRVILSNRVMVWFGLISYPLYLWHCIRPVEAALRVI